MNKLTNADILYLQQYIESVECRGKKTVRININTGSNAVREEMACLLFKEYYMYYSSWETTTFGPFQPKYLAIRCKDSASQAALCSAIEGIMAAQSTVTVHEPAGHNYEGADPDTDSNKKDLTTYIVIGAAAAVIIALIMPWKK